MTGAAVIELKRRIRKEFERVTQGDPVRHARMLDVARANLPRLVHAADSLGDDETIASWFRRAERWEIEELALAADRLGYEVEIKLRIKVQ